MTPTHDSLLPGAAPPAPRRPGWRRLVIGTVVAVAGLMTVLALCLLSLSPVVPAPRAPDGPTAAAARDVLQTITGEDTERGELVRITLAQRELDGLAALASEALQPLRLQAKLRSVPGSERAKGAKPTPPAGEIVVDASRDMGWGLWLNAVAVVRPPAATDGTALPDIAVTIGRVPLPQSATRWALNRIWAQTQSNSAKPIPLDRAMKGFAITPRQAGLVLVNPGRGTALWGLTRAGATNPDPKALLDAYCAIADTGQTNLAVLVRRAAALNIPAGTTPHEHNRVVLTAVAMRAVPEYREKLAGAVWEQSLACGASAETLTLAGREDLAKHWALSAALAATVGSQVARSMGTWKELADSTEGGTGFSFVDLSADRSGERFAMAAVNPQLARTVRLRLIAITEDQMLPREALAKPEGLDQAAFERDYTAVDSPEYARALRAIDRLLGNAGVP